MNEITIDGIEYVPKTEELNGDYVLVRGNRSGVFVGHLESEDGTVVTLLNCRRLWQWAGAASCSQLAMDGVSKPNKCKFPTSTQSHKIYDVIEMIPMTTKAKNSIESVDVWSE